MVSFGDREAKCIGGEDVFPGYVYGNPVMDSGPYPKKSYILSFQTLCDGFVEHDGIDGLNNTDETDCEYWTCNNAYTRCDIGGVWNCPDESDETNCSSNPCAPDRHPCILPYSYNFTCLPLSQINDGHIDCLGSYDEGDQCPSNLHPILAGVYRCFNETKCIRFYDVCKSTEFDEGCSAGDDQGEWCPKINNTLQGSIDPSLSAAFDSYLYQYHLTSHLYKSKAVNFKLINHLIYPLDLYATTKADFIASIPVEIARTDESNSNRNQRSIGEEAPRGFCYRGVVIYSSDLKEKSCLCPAAYFGDRCEFQSQRVSLILQFRTSDWPTVFTFVMILIDDNTNMNSYEIIDYFSACDCGKKFLFNLLYSTQPKFVNHSYYVRIDVFDKIKMNYYVSMFYPIRFSFLPVYRLSLQVNVPLQESLIIPKTCPLKCLYGQCTRFANLDKFFCRCLNGYSGKLCAIPNHCQCSSDSICVGTINKRSICVCPPNKFGPRCYLKQTICMSNPCHQGGQCVASDETIHESGYLCICPKGFMGSRCENTEMKIEFHFSESLIIPQVMIIHFIDASPKISEIKYPIHDPAQTKSPAPDTTRTTIISKIGFDQLSSIISYGGIFHLIFLELNKDYYLALLQHNYTLFVNISTTIIPEHRCAPISELLDIHIQGFSTWHRAKHYHIPCKKQPNLVCFYDIDQFMCICDIDRHANCFKFNRRRLDNCFGYNYCKNGGQCYQNNNSCPTSTACFCTECYFGFQCQLTSTGYGLSLDAILGYSIMPSVPFSRQSITVKISAAFTTIMFVIAIVNSVLSIITFRTKRSLAVGCGLYLLASSITSCLTMIIFSWKYILLVLSQMTIITNYSFLRFNCIIMNMLLQSLLAIGDWLNACVAIERAFTVHIGVKFNKRKSKTIAKGIIFIVYILTLTGYIHDPVHRRLLQDKEEERTWCVVDYSLSIQGFASFINIIHFLLPLSINIVSVLFIIVLLTRQKLKIGGKKTPTEHFWNQFHQHKHRLFSPFILVITAMPRLVISFISSCMKTARNPWLYLAGYFVSFIPPLLVFSLFVLPSQFYRKEFNDATVHIRRIIQRRFRCK